MPANPMRRAKIEALEAKLREQRDAIFTEVEHVERDLADMAAEKEAEVEEHAAERQAAFMADKLDGRGVHEIQEIDAALERIADGSFGTCEACAEDIAVARLQALPATRLCIECARQREAG